MAKKARLLIIDDEDDICHYLKSSLERTKKFEVLASTKATEGISLAKGAHPDVILLDIAMPEMDGSQVAEALRQDSETKDIPIIFITALAQKEELAVKSGIVGGNFFLAKPIDNNELISRIEIILSNKNS